MNINLKLSGVAEAIIEEMIAKGYATSKTEAIRISILDYKQHHMGKEEEMTKDDLKDLKQAIKEYKTGKTISLEDV